MPSFMQPAPKDWDKFREGVVHQDGTWECTDPVVKELASVRAVALELLETYARDLDGVHGDETLKADCARWKARILGETK